jgi:hypothetical protein
MEKNEGERERERETQNYGHNIDSCETKNVRILQLNNVSDCTKMTIRLRLRNDHSYFSGALN